MQRAPLFLIISHRFISQYSAAFTQVGTGSASANLVRMKVTENTCLYFNREDKIMVLACASCLIESSQGGLGARDLSDEELSRKELTVAWA